jgi:hypothetical protein
MSVYTTRPGGNHSRLIHLLEDVFESPIIFLQNCAGWISEVGITGLLFGRHEQRHSLTQGHLETGMRESIDTLIGIVHG